MVEEVRVGLVQAVERELVNDAAVAARVRPLAARALLAKLDAYSRRSGVAWASQRRLADELGVSERTLRRHLRALVEEGAISVRRRGQGKTNQTRVLEEEVAIMHVRKQGVIRPDRTECPLKTGQNVRSRPDRMSAPTTVNENPNQKLKESAQSTDALEGGMGNREKDIEAMRELDEVARAAESRLGMRMATPTRVRHLEMAWEVAMREHHPTVLRKAFTGKERGNARCMMGEYSPETAVEILRFAVERWKFLRDEIGRRVTLEFPTFEQVFRHREAIVAQMGSRTKFEEEYGSGGWEDHPAYIKSGS